MKCFGGPPHARQTYITRCVENESTTQHVSLQPRRVELVFGWLLKRFQMDELQLFLRPTMYVILSSSAGQIQRPLSRSLPVPGPRESCAAHPYTCFFYLCPRKLSFSSLREFYFYLLCRSTRVQSTEVYSTPPSKILGLEFHPSVGKIRESME